METTVGIWSATLAIEVGEDTDPSGRGVVEKPIDEGDCLSRGDIEQEAEGPVVGGGHRRPEAMEPVVTHPVLEDAAVSEPARPHGFDVVGLRKLEQQARLVKGKGQPGIGILDAVPKPVGVVVRDPSKGCGGRIVKIGPEGREGLQPVLGVVDQPVGEQHRSRPDPHDVAAVGVASRSEPGQPATRR